MANEFQMNWTVTEVHGNVPPIAGQTATPPGVTISVSVEGHSELTGEYFIPLYTTDETVAIRCIETFIENQLMTPFALLIERKTLGDTTGRLGFLSGVSGSVDGMCGDCVKRNIGLLPPNQTSDTEIVEEDIV